MDSRRKFLQGLAATAGSFGFLSIANNAFANEAIKRFDKFQALTPKDAMNDEDFWNWVKESYTVSSTILNQKTK